MVWKDHKARSYLQRALYANGPPNATFQWGFLLRKLSRSCFPELSKREQPPLRVKQVPLQIKDNFMRAAGDAQSKHGWKICNTCIHLFIFLVLF